MRFFCAGTGSNGNAYALVSDNGEILLVECGIQWKKILKMIDYQLSMVVGCVVSHVHSDHSKSAAELEKNGIQVFKPYESDNEIQQITFGEFVIRSFPLVHDVPCFGFYIMHKEMGTMVYITDTEYCKYKFPGVNHIAVEANYDKRLIDNDHPARYHILKGHMELQTTKQFILANRSTNLRNIILLHMSDGNMDLDVMENEIKEVSGRAMVSIAKPGLQVEMNKLPF